MEKIPCEVIEKAIQMDEAALVSIVNQCGKAKLY